MIESNIDFSLPYITAELPGIGGQLRAQVRTLYRRGNPSV